MRRIGLLIATLLLTTALPVIGQSDGQKVFERMKSLAGTWNGKTVDGKTIKTAYRLTSAGSALVQTEASAEGEMVTVFYVDGDRLMLTHFCAAKNQPRMKAAPSADLKTIAFDFVDATNLPNPQAGHMHRAVFTLVDANHYSEDWTWTEAGKEKKAHFELQRSKM